MPGAAADSRRLVRRGRGPAGDLRRQADRLARASTCCSPPGRWSTAPTPGRSPAVVGFGAARARAPRASGTASPRGDLGPLRGLADARPRASRRARTSGSRCLSAFLDRAAGRLRRCRPRRGAGSVRFAGRLEHDEVAVPGGLRRRPSSSRAPSRRRSGWSPRRRRPPARCRSRPHTPGAAEVSQAARRRRCPSRRRPRLIRASRRRRRRRSRPRLDGWLELEPARAPRRPAPRCATRVERLWSWAGVARGVLAAVRRAPRRAAACRWAIETHETSSSNVRTAQPRRDQ